MSAVKEPVVRAAKTTDAAQLRSLAEGFSASAADVTWMLFTSRLETIVADQRSCLPVAEEPESGALLGYAYAQDFGPGLRATFTTGRLHDLYVSPQARRGGLGRALVDHVFTWARGRPEPMILDWQASSTGVAFYEALGFEPDRTGDYAEFPGFCLDLREGSGPAS